jgi:hypothetical protein
VSAGEPQLITQKMHQQQPGFDLGSDLFAVDGHIHLHG